MPLGAPPEPPAGGCSVVMLRAAAREEHDCVMEERDIADLFDKVAPVSNVRRRFAFPSMKSLHPGSGSRVKSSRSGARWCEHDDSIFTSQRQNRVASVLRAFGARSDSCSRPNSEQDTIKPTRECHLGFRPACTPRYGRSRRQSRQP